jgi:hypothetical protein
METKKQTVSDGVQRGIAYGNRLLLQTFFIQIAQYQVSNK